MCVTYSDLIQIGIFIVALVGLCYSIFKNKMKNLQVESTRNRAIRTVNYPYRRKLQRTLILTMRYNI